MAECNKCLHYAVCAKYSATGGRVRWCGNFKNDYIFGDWIPVAERLPDAGQKVIVYSGGAHDPAVYAYHFWNKAYASWALITHWMPMPAPPKGEGNG